MPGRPGLEFNKQAEKHEGAQLSLHVQVRGKSETTKIHFNPYLKAWFNLAVIAIFYLMIAHVLHF